MSESGRLAQRLRYAMIESVNGQRAVDAILTRFLGGEAETGNVWEWTAGLLLASGRRRRGGLEPVLFTPDEPTRGDP
jgi:hypothetical protein